MEQADLFGTRRPCTGRSSTPCSMDSRRVCLCALDEGHPKPCKCNLCGLAITWEGEAFSRSADPPTAQAAAARMRGEPAGRLEQLVVDTLRAQGRMTSTMVAEALGMDKWSISPRMAPLRRKQLIRDSNERTNGQILWEAV